MRTFQCSCGTRVFFDNSHCLSCNSELGFLPERRCIAAIGSPEAADYRKCSNYFEHGTCNWMIPASDPDPLCRACRLNNTIPDLSSEGNRQLWSEVEKAKRRLIYGLSRLGLPIVPKTQDPERGLSFDIKSGPRVLTGHSDGLITLNLAEADSVTREKARVAMKERYRTLLGHFRHEIGHYYWERLIRDTPELPAFRALFGDERTDYAQALDQHYGAEPDPGWNTSFITPYARAHPWEDWAETFAHYLHMTDTLETAHHFGFTSKLPLRQTLSNVTDFDLLMAEWTELTIALNALNRCMGLPDAYPFAITPAVREKLEFVQRVVNGTR